MTKPNWDRYREIEKTFLESEYAAKGMTQTEFFEAWHTFPKEFRDRLRPIVMEQMKILVDAREARFAHLDNVRILRLTKESRRDSGGNVADK